MRLFDYFKDQEEFISEKNKICKNKKKLERKISQLLEDLNDIKNKYTELLEQKSERFDLYINYQKQCEVLVKEKRSLKKELAETNEMCNLLTSANEEMTEKIDKLEKRLKRTEKQNEKNN